VKASFFYFQLYEVVKFQTPFGITACERRTGNPVNLSDYSFKRLSASLHVKGSSSGKLSSQFKFQTPFGITACESHPGSPQGGGDDLVSNAFRHHCM